MGPCTLEKKVGLGCVSIVKDVVSGLFEAVSVSSEFGDLGV